jgi:hypothetical protein
VTQTAPARRGDTSTDADGDTLTYAWTIASKPAHSAAALSDPAAVAPTFTADLEGRYQVRLVVNDGTASSPPQTIAIAAAYSRAWGGATLVGQAYYANHIDVGIDSHGHAIAGLPHDHEVPGRGVNGPPGTPAGAWATHARGRTERIRRSRIERAVLSGRHVPARPLLVRIDFRRRTWLDQR